MSYLSVWKVLDQIVADFRKRGTVIPDKTMSDLKTARTLLNTLKTPQESSETIVQIEACLANVEAYLISEGEKRLGKQYADHWLKRIDEASKKPSDTQAEKERFIPGIPREQKWIRVKPSSDLPLDKLKTLAKESSLLCRTQDDGYLLVCGPDRQLKDFVKKMTTKHEAKPRK